MRLVRLAARTTCIAFLAVLSFTPISAADPENELSITSLTPLCAAAGDQLSPHVVPDDQGGATVMWVDYRSGRADLYAQHVRRMGTGLAVDWAANGVAMSRAPYTQYMPELASDGAGGAFAVWVDSRADNSDIYAQRIVAGTFSPKWKADGMPVCSAAGVQHTPVVVNDHVGGGYFAWVDYRSQTAAVYLQHLNSRGRPMSGWAENGIRVTTDAGEQQEPVMIADGSHGVYLAWDTSKDGASRVVLQRIVPSGARANGWPESGVALSTMRTRQSAPVIANDLEDGVFIAWTDKRNGTEDIYLQRVTGNGTIATGWPKNGVPVCSARRGQQAPALQPDGGGGVYLVWEDRRTGAADLYLQHFSKAGAPFPGWSEGGLPLSWAPQDQILPSLASDGRGGVVASWLDFRSGTPLVYAQHLTAAGLPADGWPAGGRAVSATANGQYSPAIASDGATGAYVVCETGFDGPDIAAAWIDGGSATTGSPAAPAPVAAASPMLIRPILALEGFVPNPTRQAPVIAFTLPSREPAHVELLDVQGRRIAGRQVGDLGPGRHLIDLGHGLRLAPGLYFVRLTQANKALVRRGTILK